MTRTASEHNEATRAALDAEKIARLTGQLEVANSLLAKIVGDDHVYSLAPLTNRSRTTVIDARRPLTDSDRSFQWEITVEEYDHLHALGVTWGAKVLAGRDTTPDIERDNPAPDIASSQVTGHVSRDTEGDT